MTPPSGSDWRLINTLAPNVLPSDANAGIDQSTHNMSPYGVLPAVQEWISSFINTAAAQGKRVYYVGVWGSASRSSYQIIVVTDR